MVDEAKIGDLVHASAIQRAHPLHRASGPFGGRAGEGQLLGGFHVAPAMLPALILVGDQLASVIRGSANLPDVRRPEIVPSMLVPTHELQAHRLAGELRKNGRGLRDIVVATVAIGPRAFVILDANLIRGEAENAAQGGTRSVHILRGAHYQHRIRPGIRKSAIWRERCMRLVGAKAGLRSYMSRPADCAGCVSALPDD